jgi:hypothetical protein
MHASNKKQKTASACGKVRQEENALSLYSYVDRLVIERSAWLEPHKPGEQVRIVEKITLTASEIDTLVAMLPLAILERERAKRSKKSSNRPIYSGDMSDI